MLKHHQPLVTLENAGAYSGKRWLVRGVDLEVRRGEVVTLIGPNGSGKSTTVKMALGLTKAREGAVKRAPNLSIGYVPQKLTIDWSLPLSVRRMMSLTRTLDENKIDDALKKTGVVHLKNAQMRNLSGGEFQRVLLARALALNPDLLVLDEPVQGVDFKGELELYDLISQIKDTTGCGVLMVSHDLNFVMAATDHVVCLNGHVCCTGTPTSVVETKAYRDLFGQRGAAALAVYEHDHDHTHLPDGRVQHADGSITHHCHPADGHHDHG